MKRREFIAWMGGAAATFPTSGTWAQPAMPVIGFLHSASLEPNAKRLSGFRKGLREAGFTEGQNVAIEFRWAAGQNARLPELAAELVAKPVSVIATLSSTPATLAAKAATSAIPIFFLIAEDPVELGLVASLNRPGGNVTGISSQNAELVAKRLGLLRELAPQAPNIAVLLNHHNPNAKPVAATLQAAAATLGVQLNLLEANSDAEIEKTFASLQAGTYVARILKGQKPGEIPVMRPTKFEYVINLKTARTLGLDVPPAMQARADEVIE